MEIVSKNSFLLCFPGAFPRLASAKVRTFLITQKPFPFFSYKKPNFFQIKEGTQYYIYARASKYLYINSGEAASFRLISTQKNQAMERFLRANNSKMLLK